MDRSKFVGLVVHSSSMDEREPEDYILCEFSGEGSTSIVFGVTPRSAPQDPQWVMKFLKPDVRFELTVLHHSFEIAEELYPDHPLLMAPEERMRRLGDEMLSRIESPGVLFRIAAYRDLLASTLGLLAGQFSQSFKPDTSPRDLMRELGPVVPMIDDNLIRQIESNLEDDAFVDDLQPFFEQCLDSLQAMITAARQDGVYRPFSQNALFKLLGLHLENFINWEELISISSSPQFQKLVSMQDVEDFRFVVSALHFRASARKRRMNRDAGGSSVSETDSWEFKTALSAAKTAARYLDSFAAGRPSLEHIQGYSRNWLAQGLMLEDNNAEAIQAFEQALDVLTTPNSLAERHDALLDLSSLLENSEPKRAATYANEAMEIRRRLEER
jgi:tetratricopeptide (TPR) repeat protein